MSDIEKRRHHRFLALLETRVLPGDHVPADLKIATIDLSTGGARCASNRPLQAESVLKMTLSLIGGDLKRPMTLDLQSIRLMSEGLR